MNQSGEALRRWVDAQWPFLQVNDFELKPEFHGLGDTAPDWQALPGDAGFRQYYRLASVPPLLAVYAPPETEDLQAFLRVGQYLRHAGVNAPAIAAYDEEQGFLLLEDFGPTLLYDELLGNINSGLYLEALESLLHIQQAPVDLNVMPRYSQAMLRNELNVFTEWFVERLLAYEPDNAERDMLNAWFGILEDSALAQPQVAVHRDFHSRNLVHRAGGKLGIIDFQDAVAGPYTYDLVSLLRDCYLQLPPHLIEQMCESYLETAMASGILPKTEMAQFSRDFDLMGLQRHIKVLGVFSRLSLRDGKHSYLKDLSLTVHYVVDIASNYSEAQEFIDWFQRQLVPLIETQPWYQATLQAG